MGNRSDSGRGCVWQTSDLECMYVIKRQVTLGTSMCGGEVTVDVGVKEK